MKKSLIILLSLLTLFTANNSFAQKSKKHKSKTVQVKKNVKHKKKTTAKKISVNTSTSAPVDYSSLFNKVYLIHDNKEMRASLIREKEALNRMESFIQNAIYQHAFPGCQVFASKNGQIIYQKSFGSFSYDKLKPVTDTSLYDIASVTKIVATTLAVMKLYDEGKIALNGTLAGYLSRVKGTDKASLRISDLLTHQAGLKSWIPFYRSTLDSITKMPRNDIYSTRKDSVFTIPVASNFYMNKAYVDTIWETIVNSPLENKGRYVYSDLDLLFMQKVVEAVTGKPLEQYVDENFFQPLALKHTMYNPWKKGLQKQCAPTENDQAFRLQLLQGYVHDPGAAMAGGVAGHAGVFSNAADIAVVMQMLLNGGEYRGRKYISKETIRLFTGYRSGISRRGYGFDKPEKKAGDGGPASALCGKTTFGHQGFTGTCAWADPETGIVFVFLANRVYPSADNSLINSLGVRTKVQDYIYQALGEQH